MYDFDDFLAQGISAAQKGHSTEAIKYLKIAAKIKPRNARVWLWLATAAQTVAEKRVCLEHALKLAPDTLVAKALLERLNRMEPTTDGEPADLVIFVCPSCGGKQHFDPDRLGLLCEYCNHIEPLLATDASNAELELKAEPSNASGNWGVLDGQASCQACGANLYLSADRGSLTCPFCGSNEVIILPITPNLVAPTAVGTFLIQWDDVYKILDAWWHAPLLPPPGRLNPHLVTIAPIYLPFWTFDGRVQISLSGHHFDKIYPEVYSEHDRAVGVLRNRRAAFYEYDVDDFLVYAAHSISEEKVSKIHPFLLKSLLEYSPAILAGWPAQIYQIALEDAATLAHKRMRDTAFRAAMAHNIFLGQSEMLSSEVKVLNRTYKLILLPVWVIRYTFRDYCYQVLVNGQTGQARGERPPNKIMLVLALLALVIFLALSWRLILSVWCLVSSRFWWGFLWPFYRINMHC